MYITQHMTRNPYTITRDTKISEAARLLRDHNFRHLPVVDTTGCLLGMVTDRDLRSAWPSAIGAKRELSREQAVVAGAPISEIMSKEVVSLTVFSTLDDALLLLDRKKVGALPVLDNSKKVVGIFSTRDLIQAYRDLFGLGEKGSALVVLENDGRPRPLTRIVQVMEEHDMHFSRIIQKKGKGPADTGGLIYIRVNTCNIHAVHSALEETGFKLFSNFKTMAGSNG